MTRSNLFSLGNLFPAFGYAVLTTGVKRTAAGRFQGAGDFPFQRRVFDIFRIGHRYRGEQSHGIRVAGAIIKSISIRQFHKVPQVHDPDMGADVFDHGQVVGDNQIGQAQLCPKIHQEIQDLGLNGNIQGRNRLIEHNHLRVQSQSPGDGDTLPLTATEFMGILPRLSRGETDQGSEFSDAVLNLLFCAHVVNPQGLTDDLPDFLPGIQRPKRVLKNSLDTAPEMEQLPPFKPVDIPAPEQDSTQSGRFKRQDRVGGGRLAAAGLSHQPQGFALPDVKRDIFHSPDISHHPWEEHSPGDGKVFLEALNGQHDPVVHDLPFFIQPTGHQMILFELDFRRIFFPAFCYGLFAPGRETASGRRIDQAGGHALD